MPSEGAAPRLVGRVAEREALAALTDSLGSAGGAAMLVGEAGMGKTALLSTLAAAVSSRPAVQVTWLRGTESEAVLPFAAVADLLLPLREHFGLLPDGQRQALGACLGLSGDPPGGPLAVHAGALSVLAAAADRKPLLILVDDFQWLDPESRKILLFIARRVGKIADKHGPRWLLIIGPAITGLGFLLLSFVKQTAGPSEYWTTFFPSILVFGIGMALTVAPLTTAVMTLERFSNSC